MKQLKFEMNQIVNGDCEDVMDCIPENTFNMVFADPPFNLDKKYESYKDNIDDGDYLDWCHFWIENLVAKTKPGGSIFIHNIPKWLIKYACIMDDFDVEFRHWISWDAPTAPMGQSLQPAHYGILYYTKNGEKPKINELRMPHKRCRDKKCNLLLKDYGGKKASIHPFGPLVSDVWGDIHRCKHDKYKDDHPCQLPIPLLERLILLCTDEGDSVFDPFMGTGTTAISAKRLGRNFYGSEKDPKYAEIGNQKILAENQLSRLDSVWASCYLGKVHTARCCDIWNSKTKKFCPQWKKLFKSWPDSDDERRMLNTKDLEFRDDIKVKIREICESNRSLQHGVEEE